MIDGKFCNLNIVAWTWRMLRSRRRRYCLTKLR